MIRGVAVLICALAAPAAGAPLFELPIACTPGQDCFIQNYVDRDPGPDAVDFTCGGLTYDGHKGTDFALPDLARAHATEVLAPADGRVLRLRDGVPDRDLGQPLVEDGAECGNGLILDHGDGWESQFCHLAAGSLLVRPGQRVQAGQPLGHVGLSGLTEFPHLHFSLKKDGRVTDPFASDAATCGAAGSDLWATPLAYQATGPVSAGFTTAIPTLNDVVLGVAAEISLPTTAPALVGWASFFGVRQGDQIRITIDGPEGRFTRHQVTADRDQVRAMRAAGRRRGDGPWAIGSYQIRADLTRNGRRIAEITARLDVR